MLTDFVLLYSWKCAVSSVAAGKVVPNYCRFNRLCQVSHPADGNLSSRMFLHQYQKNLVAVDDRGAFRVFYKARTGEGQKVRKGESSLSTRASVLKRMQLRHSLDCISNFSFQNEIYITKIWKSSLYIPCDDSIVVLRCSITEPGILKITLSVLYSICTVSSIKIV